MWAEHKSRPECFGVSLGVRSFVRPLYLYIKLSQLRKKNGNNNVKPEDVNAFRSIIGNRESSENKIFHKSKYKKSEDGLMLKSEVTEPCLSCQIVFGGFKGFNYLGNCAEYDVIRTDELDALLNREQQHWNDFKDACQKHFEAFKKLARKVEAGENPPQCLEMPVGEASPSSFPSSPHPASPSSPPPLPSASSSSSPPPSSPFEEIKTYYNETLDVKVLKYEWNNTEKAFKLTAKKFREK
jgi:hypothetical protein